MSERDLLTADETATKLSVTRRTILRWARENKIESIRVSNKKILFSRDAVDEFLKNRTNRVELPESKSEKGGRWTSAPIPKKGGDKRTSGESWRDLRQEVSSWES
jgi:excisionase family DNA binding protein